VTIRDAPVSRRQSHVAGSGVLIVGLFGATLLVVLAMAIVIAVGWGPIGLQLLDVPLGGLLTRSIRAPLRTSWRSGSPRAI